MALNQEARTFKNHPMLSKSQGIMDNLPKKQKSKGGIFRKRKRLLKNETESAGSENLPGRSSSS